MLVRNIAPDARYSWSELRIVEDQKALTLHTSKWEQLSDCKYDK